MKRKDFLLIAVVIILASVISIVISSAFISSESDRQQSVETVEALPSEFDRPPTDYFNEESVNPTQDIEIGDDPNNQPFDTE
jgi:hypothetical protein